MPKSNPPKPPYDHHDEQHRVLRQLFEELWDPRAVSDGAVKPSRGRMEDRQREQWRGVAGAGRIRTVGAGKALDRSCTRFSSLLDSPIDANSDLDVIVPHIAEFVLELRRIKPFGRRGQRSLETFAIHDCCKFVGCPPPHKVIGKPEWRAAMKGGQNGSPLSERIDALSDLLHNGIYEAASGTFAEAMAEGRGRTHRARKRRREAISREMSNLITAM
jgi:hypothetical protein